MSMPLMACSTEPPRPCQNDDWRSFSETRSGSIADSSFQQRPEQLDRAGDQHRQDVKQLPKPESAVVGVDSTSVCRVFFCLVTLGPAAVDPCPPIERDDFDAAGCVAESSIDMS